nr:START domain-containing protein [Pseudomonas duriflava]
MIKTIVLTTMLTMLSVWTYAQDWKLAKDEDGIKVYTRSMEGSKYKAYRGIVQIKATPEQIAQLQENATTSCAWLYRCQQLKVLKQQGREGWTYMRIEMPWPVTARDVVLHVTSEQLASGGFLRRLKGVPDYIPPVEGYIRVSSFDGTWQVTPKTADNVEVIYEAQSEPGGSVPSWLANSFVVDAPFNTLQRLRKTAESR